MKCLLALFWAVWALVYITWLVSSALLYSKGDYFTLFVKWPTVIWVFNYEIAFWFGGLWFLDMSLLNMICTHKEAETDKTICVICWKCQPPGGQGYHGYSPLLSSAMDFSTWSSKKLLLSQVLYKMHCMYFTELADFQWLCVLGNGL